MGSEFGTVLPVPCPFHVDKRGGGGGGWLFPLILVSTPNLLAPASLLFFDCKYYAVLCNLFPFPPLPLLLGNPTSQTLFSCHPYAFHPPPHPPVPFISLVAPTLLYFYFCPILSNTALSYLLPPSKVILSQFPPQFLPVYTHFTHRYPLSLPHPLLH